MARFNYMVDDSTLSVTFNNLSNNAALTFWDFGDGTSQVVQTQSVTHSYTNSGEYLVKLRLFGPGCSDSTSKRICVSCIFPGDANFDGIVNNTDVLYVGIGYGAVGPVRQQLSTAGSITTTPWVNSTGPANFLAGHNYSHADCDGNGIINRFDLQLIEQNYGFRSPKTLADDCISPDDIPLYFEILDSIPAGTSVNVAVMLGNNQLTARDVYGIAYTIHYSHLLIEPGSITLDYGSSLFGPMSDIIFLTKDSNQLGKIETAISRIDHQNVNINGQIGTINFVMEENLAQKTLITEILNLSFSEIMLIRSDETVIPVCGWQDSSIVYEKLLTTGDEALGSSKVSIYPNPASHYLHINFAGGNEFEVALLNIVGKRMWEKKCGKDGIQCNVSQLPRGIYFISVSNRESTEVYKVEITR